MKLRKRRRGLRGGGGGDELVLAVPGPVGGRLEDVVEGAGVLDCTSAGDGGVRGISEDVGVVLTVCEMGPVGTPATVLVCAPGMTALSTGLFSAYVLYTAY